MYSALKKILLTCFPARWVIRAEYKLRWLYSLLYVGSAVKCPVCSRSFSAFISLPGSDLICPRCGSLPRHRRLWMMLQQNDLLKKGAKWLHFSPARILQKKLSEILGEGYTSTDYNQEACTDVHYDITDIPLPDGSFDRIICFHVLEHIQDDKKAIHELYRMLKQNGVAWIQTPFHTVTMIEDDTITSAAERLQHFGQEDHVRIYSVEGLCTRLQEAGFRVTVKQFEADSLYGLGEDTILVCKRN